MSEDTTRPDASDLLAHGEFLRRLAWRLLRDEHGAEDVVQDALVVALENGHERRGAARPWLSGIVRNLSFLALRSRSRRARRERLVARREPVVPAADAVARMETARRVVDAVATLEERYRTVVVLRFFDGLTSAEIARRLDCPEATVRTRLRRALAALRGRFDREHDGSRRAWGLALLPLLGSRGEPVRAIETAGGGILMKKVAVVMVVLVLLLLGAVTFVALRRSEAPANAIERVAQIPEEPEETTAGAPVPFGEPFDPAGEDAAPAGSNHPPDNVAEIVVVGPDGSPVAGADVVLYEDTPGRRLAFDQPPARAAGRTDDAGRVRLPIVPVRRHMLKVSHAGLATLVDVECFGGNVTRLTMPVGGTFLGTVTDAETTEPIAGVEVTVMDFAMCGFMHYWRVKTTADGRYRIEGIGPGLLNMWATHPDYAEGPPDATVARSVPGRETVLDFKMKRGVRVALRVTDRETGRILPDVEVVWARDPVARGRGDGLVTQPVPGALGALELRAEGYLIETVDHVNHGPARPGDPIEVRMTRGVPVRGSILREDGSPAPDVPVRLLFVRRGQYAENWRETRTGSDGTFELEGADPGGTLKWEIDLPGGGVRDIDPVAVPEEAAEVVLEAIVLTPTVTIRGRLLDPDGQVIPRAVVRAFDGEGDALAACFSDPRGRFRLAGLPPGPLLLGVGAMSGWAGQSLRFDVREDWMLTWPLKPGLEISGVVVREDGSPPAPMTIAIGESGYERTDAMGRFRVRGLDAGPHLVRLSNRPDVAPVEVPGGTHNLRLVLPR